LSGYNEFVTATDTEKSEPGLRERKKLRTREGIADVARRLFSERGFEQVTVAEIARAAEVSEQTVFNHFPSKEDLVYWRLGSFEEALLAAIREREPGASVLDAFRGFLLAQRGLLAEVDEDRRREFVGMARMIEESPALKAREAQVMSAYTDALAEVIAEETGEPADAISPRVAANALVGVHRSLISLTRRGAVAGTPQPELAERVRAEAERAFALLEEGLGGYGA
jgi:AcrR family transcriptional regulator